MLFFVKWQPYDPASIAAQINRLIPDRALHGRLRDNIPAALGALRADVERDKVVAVYRDIAAGAVGLPFTLARFRGQTR